MSILHDDVPRQTIGIQKLSLPEKFLAYPLLRGPHAQTIAAVYLPGTSYPYRARQHAIEFQDGDRVVLHDDRPAGWKSGNPIILLLHGLGGCFASRYMARAAGKLNAVGLRTFRMDQRGCGTSLKTSRFPFHAGRSEDVATVIQHLSQLCPESPCVLIGFSIGGNVALKLLGEIGAGPCGQLVGGISICPPIDLAATVNAVESPRNRVYRWFIVQALLRQHALRRQHVANAKTVRFARRPRGLREFDEVLTAPLCGFSDARSYYRACSARPLLMHIRRPTIILTAKDDPVIPFAQFDGSDFSPSIRFYATDHGGHLGFLARRQRAHDRRWMEWRIVDWVQAILKDSQQTPLQA